MIVNQLGDFRADDQRQRRQNVCSARNEDRFKVRSTETIAFVSVLRTLKTLFDLNATDVWAALPLVADTKFVYWS